MYDTAGHQLGTMQPSGAMKRMELYAGARHLATYDIASNATYFIHGDWQGSERMRTNTAGASYETCYNLPFGDGQTCAGGADISPMHFTGKPRDTETTLDYFGARYYNSSGARWMSPDWAAKPATVPYAQFGDPQSLNLYGYVTDNPVSKQDGDGHLISIYQLYSNGGGMHGISIASGSDGDELSKLQKEDRIAAGQEAQKPVAPKETLPPPGTAKPTTGDKQATVDKDKKEAQRRLTNPACATAVDAAFKAAGGDGTAAKVSSVLGNASSVDIEGGANDPDAAATGPAHTSGNVIYPTDSYFTSQNTNGPGTLIGEAMHMKDFGNSSGGIGDAAFADGLHRPYTHASAGGDNDLAASGAFHSYIENACPSTW